MRLGRAEEPWTNVRGWQKSHWQMSQAGRRAVDECPWLAEEPSANVSGGQKSRLLASQAEEPPTNVLGWQRSR
jgi:hypothetical protein